MRCDDQPYVCVYVDGKLPYKTTIEKPWWALKWECRNGVMRKGEIKVWQARKRDVSDAVGITGAIRFVIRTGGILGYLVRNDYVSEDMYTLVTRFGYKQLYLGVFDSYKKAAVALAMYRRSIEDAFSLDMLKRTIDESESR